LNAWSVMKQTLKYYLLFTLLAISLPCASCAPQLKNPIEIKTNGFINDNNYQAILEIESDDSSRGLVARRESAYLKAKSAQLDDLALESLVNYCIDSQLKAGIIEKNKSTPDINAHKAVLKSKLKGLAGGGKIAFVYYNEKNAMVIGYRIFSIGFKKKLDAVIASPAGGKQETQNSAIRS
jgi:hypothetical protein